MECELLHTKENIILAAIDVIDENGIHGLSTREVAKRVGISEPAIFKHFKSKSELLLAVLDHFSLYDLDVIQSIQLKYKDPIEAIICFVETFATYYENYPAITAMTQNMDLLRKDTKLTDKIKGIYLTRTTYLTEIIEQAKRIGEIDKNVDSEGLAVVIIGIVREWCLKWRILDYSFSLREKILSTLMIVLKAFEI